VFSALAITSWSDALPSANSPQSLNSGSSDVGWVQKDVPAPSASACGAEPIQTKSSLSGCTGVQSRKIEKGVARKKGPLKVLVVDDGAGSRTTLKALLTRQKHSIEVAKNGEEAISKVNAARYDVAIINASLQGMSGFDVVSQLRVLEKAEGYPPCFVIGVTPSDAEIEECLMSGMNATLAKPVNKDELLELLSQLLVDPADTDDGESPARDNVQQAASSANEAGEPDQEHGPRMVPKCPARILIVEDHWANRKLIEAMLLQRGHILDCVENGQEAVTMTSAVEYDLILMDCNMPMMDGWQATEKIRQRRELNASVPIVAVTANAMKGDRDKCIQAGMDDYISKPVDRKKLYEIIAKWTMVEEQAGAPESHTTQRGSSIPKHPMQQKMGAKGVEDSKGPDGEFGKSGESDDGFVSASG
jgi:CheY-like chemotaxis protein